MSTFSSLIQQIGLLLLSAGSLAFIVKVVLYFRVEKEWDAIRFFHYSRIDLKMTVSKDLRNWRKKQNLLSNVFLSFIVLFLFSSFFRILIGN